MRTTLEQTIVAGTVKIPMTDSDTKGFKAGQKIIVGDGEFAEERFVIGLGSLILDRPLEYGHRRGEPIVVSHRRRLFSEWPLVLCSIWACVVEERDFVVGTSQWNVHMWNFRRGNIRVATCSVFHLDTTAALRRWHLPFLCAM